MLTATDGNKVAAMGKEISKMGRLIELIEERSNICNVIEEGKAMLHEEKDEDMIALIGEDITSSQEKLDEVEEELIKSLIPRDEADDRPIILEIRAGTGGDEASLFAQEMFSMYEKYTKLQGWKWEQLSFSTTDIGGFKEAQALIQGDGVYHDLKFESGVHRVQRIPSNDKVIHTSAITVVVLPQAQELDVVIKNEDIKIDLYRSSGKGGQSVNTTDSAVRMTHIPTGVVVAMQDERSQVANRKKAMMVLRSRIYDYERKVKEAEERGIRQAVDGTGDRSDKIRTYNFPQDRCTDHRVGMTINGLDGLLKGEKLWEIIQHLQEDDRKSRLEFFMSKHATSL